MTEEEFLTAGSSRVTALQKRWAREDAFIGPRLPLAINSHWEEREDRAVLSCGGRWYAKPLGSIAAQGPFADILEARSAPLEDGAA